MGEPLGELVGYVEKVRDLEACCATGSVPYQHGGCGEGGRGKGVRVADSQRMFTNPSTSLHSSEMDL